MADKLALEQRRRSRLRYQLKVKGGGRPRLSVYRSGRHIYAQVIDDGQARTLAAASTLEKELREAGGAGFGKLTFSYSTAGPNCGQMTISAVPGGTGASGASASGAPATNKPRK